MCISILKSDLYKERNGENVSILRELKGMSDLLVGREEHERGDDADDGDDVGGDVEMEELAMLLQGHT